MLKKSIEKHSCNEKSSTVQIQSCWPNLNIVKSLTKIIHEQDKSGITMFQILNAEISWICESILYPLLEPILNICLGSHWPKEYEQCFNII